VSTRLNKFLADRGVASRRASDRLIEDGRVRINGRVVTELGTQIEEQRDRVSVDGKPVGGRERHVYFVLNKPVGVITTLYDPEGRNTVKSLLPRGARVYPVGRLDADTSGLLLLTNDGALAHRLMHPRYGVAKIYRVRLAREPRPDQLRRLTSGVRFDRDRVSGPARARRIDPGFDAIMIEMVVHEGRFRQVRKMCEAVGLEVTGLHRVGYGPIRLGPLARGMFRELSDEEVAKLKSESARAGGDARPAGGGPARERPASRARPAAVQDADAEGRDDEDDEDDVEDTWIAGGGFLEPEDDDEEGGAEPPSRVTEPKRRSAPARPSEWPARATDRRGDDDWRPSERPESEHRPSERRPSGRGPARGLSERRPSGRGPSGRQPERRPSERSERRPVRAGGSTRDGRRDGGRHARAGGGPRDGRRDGGRPVRAGGSTRDSRRDGGRPARAGGGPRDSRRDGRRDGGRPGVVSRDATRSGRSAPPRSRAGGPGQRSRSQQGPRANDARGPRRPRERAGRIAGSRVQSGGRRSSTRNPSRRKPR
jgi:23S rRNA pseudouridine2605 synthase